MKQLDPMVRDGEERTPLNEDERNTMLWAGWKPADAEPKKAPKRAKAGDPLPSYDAPPQVPDAQQ
jgi:hypothetical protein